jgi:hypothetical protein
MWSYKMLMGKPILGERYGIPKTLEGVLGHMKME